MPLFDRYIAVDWSAANTPKRGKDSIWIGELGPKGRVPSENPPTRHAAMEAIATRLLSARQRGERIMLGFDFVFGYPRGAAAAIAGSPDWRALWQYLATEVVDAADNGSNRFQLAEAINHRLADGPHFWGHPHQHSYADLHPKRPVAAYANIPERRAAERYVRSAQPVWKLTGVGSVGSQAMLGIARLEALRSDPRFAAEIAVWPFETSFADDLGKPIVVTEIYPSLFPVTEADGLPRDRAQVEITTTRFAALDRAGLLGRFLSPPAGLTAEARDILIAEEGWIAGAGHEALLAQLQDAA
jgi:precorrin-8X/cobalt-precorrin-8 methylmutase